MEAIQLKKEELDACARSPDILRILAQMTDNGRKIMGEHNVFDAYAARAIELRIEADRWEKHYAETL